jgi:NRAMP (natural resistance-associated macrophage protein)-like metal ion transporter
MSFDSIVSKAKKAFKILGPGLVTGASDDDPSGIATYSQAGAQFGFATLWTALLTFPLMAAMQGMCARIGLVTSKGLTGTLKQYYPKSILYLMILFSFPAVILNIGADIQSIGAVSNLLVPQVPPFVFSVLFTALLIFIIVKYPYQKVAAILKWLCLTLLLYMVVPFLVHPDWQAVLHHTFIPVIHFNKDFLGILVAILGTTISPYLFFWQATMEVEDKKKTRKIFVSKRMLGEMKGDVNAGMFLSNLIMFFLILTAGAVLYKAGIRKIDTVEQAAKALEPLAGKLSYILFALGVIGTGILAIPVLAGCISYIFAEAFGFSKGLDKKFYQARPFYSALLYTAILYGLTAPVMIVIVLHIGNNKKIMGNHTNKLLSNILGFITLSLMTLAAVGLLYFQFV